MDAFGGTVALVASVNEEDLEGAALRSSPASDR
jgi:hypothetical protein